MTTSQQIWKLQQDFERDLKSCNSLSALKELEEKFNFKTTEIMARVKKGRVFIVPNTERKFGSNPTYCVMHADDENGNEFTLAFTEHSLAEAKKLALRNPEDVPKKPFLTDLTDDL